MEELSTASLHVVIGVTVAVLAISLGSLQSSMRGVGVRGVGK